MQKIVTDVNGKRYLRQCADIPADHLAVMQYRRDECDGLLSVNQQIRDAIRGHLCGLVYIGLYIQ